MAKISIIIPVFNAEKYLRKCLESVINQTFKDIEILCINDGSTDSSLDILNEYAEKDERVRVFSQENSGAAEARNFGLANANGEYVYFLDSDDFVHSDILEKLYNQAELENADICICNFNYYDEAAFEKKTYQWTFKSYVCPSKCFSASEIPDSVLQICIPNLFIKLYKKDFLNKYNLSFQNLKSCNDVFFDRAALILAEKITYVDEILATYRINRKGSISSTRGKSFMCMIYAYKYLKKFLQKYKNFNLIKKSYYISMKNGSIYEYRNCDLKGKVLFLKALHKILPYYDFRDLLNSLKIEYNDCFGNSITILKLESKQIYLLNFKHLIQNIFSVKNSNFTHKKITLFGIRMNFKINRVN